jgi:hypothetical protein
MPISFLKRNSTHLSHQCENLKLFRDFHLHNCTARLYQRLDRKGHFVLEPLLCYSAASSITPDLTFTGGCCHVKLTLTIRDEAVMDEVKAKMHGMHVESVEWMQLWDGEIEVSSHLSRWRVDSLRLTSDRTEAEMRVHCSDWEACDLLK